MNVEVFVSLRQVFREKEPECSGEQSSGDGKLMVIKSVEFHRHGQFPPDSVTTSSTPLLIERGL